MRYIALLFLLFIAACSGLPVKTERKAARSESRAKRIEAKKLAKDSIALAEIIERRPGWQKVHTVILWDTVYIPQVEYKFRLVPVQQKALDEKKVDSLFAKIEEKLDDIQVSGVKQEIKQMLHDRPLIKDTTITRNGVTFRAWWKEGELNIDLVTPEKKIAYEKQVDDRTIQPPTINPEKPMYKISWFWWLIVLIIVLLFLITQLVKIQRK